MTTPKDTETPDKNQCASKTLGLILVHEAAEQVPGAEQSAEDSEPQGVFVYGTLMSEELLSWLLTGSPGNYKDILALRQPAILKHYRRVPLKIDDYPALIVGTTSDQVEGFFVIPTCSSQWTKLDDFEGEEYRRHDVSVYLKESGTPVPAQVYLWNGDMDDLLLEGEWDYAYFRNERLQGWLDEFAPRRLDSCSCVLP